MNPLKLSLISMGILCGMLDLAYTQRSEKPKEALPKLSLAESIDSKIQGRMQKSRHAKGSAPNHFERGMLYKEAANSLYNQSRYKQAFRLYEKAEQELLKAAEKHDRHTEAKQKSQAYYQLGLVCEQIRNDKSVAAECFAKARELDTDAEYLALKLARTKEGRQKLGVRKVEDFKKLRMPRKGQDASDELEEPTLPKNPRENKNK